MKTIYRYYGESNIDGYSMAIFMKKKDFDKINLDLSNVDNGTGGFFRTHIYTKRSKSYILIAFRCGYDC